MASELGGKPKVGKPRRIEPRELDRRVEDQVRRMALAWEHRDHPGAKIDLRRRVDQNPHREGRCYYFSQEAVIALATDYGMPGAVIVKLTRPDPSDRSRTEQHHVVLTPDDRVIDLTAQQFAGASGARLRNMVLVPWEEAMARLGAIGFTPERIRTEAEFLEADSTVGPQLPRARRDFGMTEYRPGTYGKRTALPR